MRAELILAGGRVRALGRSGLRVRSHLAIAGDRVVAVGGAEVMGLRGPRTRVVRLAGDAVLPGFNDAHAHVVYHGLTRFGADLGGAKDFAEIQRRLRAHGRSLAAGEWQQGMGFRSSELAEGRAPHRTDLDAATGSRPAFIDERGGHLRVANTAALAAAAITASTPDPHGGRIERGVGGTPNGVLLESAMRMVADVQPPPSRGRRTEAILASQDLLVSRGVTSVGAAVNRGFADDLLCYARLADSGRLKIRVNEFLSWELLEGASELGVRAHFGGDMLRAGPIKVFVDGGAERIAVRGGAAMWRTTPEELRVLVERASAAGLQVAAHAIGDAAIEAMCDAVQSARATHLRHRVEHCTVCPPDLRRRLARLGMVAVMQPLASSHLARQASLLFLARHRRDVAAHGPLMDAGVHVAFSSDLPVTPDPNPWTGIRAAMDDPVNGVSLGAALHAYTAAGAYSSFDEGVKGALEPGMLADVQVYGGDPLAAGREGWEALRPRAVLVGGALVFGRL